MRNSSSSRLLPRQLLPLQLIPVEFLGRLSEMVPLLFLEGGEGGARGGGRGRPRICSIRLTLPARRVDSRSVMSRSGSDGKMSSASRYRAGSRCRKGIRSGVLNHSYPPFGLGRSPFRGSPHVPSRRPSAEASPEIGREPCPGPALKSAPSPNDSRPKESHDHLPNALPKPPQLAALPSLLVPSS